MKRFFIWLAALAALTAPAAQAQHTEQERIGIAPAPSEPGPNRIVLREPGSDEWVTVDVPASTGRPLPQLYMEAGSCWMTVITLCLIAMCFATWKAPRWVKELGLLAIFTGFLSLMAGLYGVFDFVQSTGSKVSFPLLCGGLRVALIAPLYGTVVYMGSLLLRIALKPRM